VKLLVYPMAVSMVATVAACVSDRASLRDASTPEVQFVAVEDDVRLEVLDWGGSGQPVVLLAGSGLTAHIYDEFAPRLTDCCHVYGITRRGYGASSRPDSGYDDQRLADDVFQVLDSVKIDAPVLVGHSMAGGELTTLGNQHSDRLAGLVYLDALGDPRDFPASDPAYMALLQKLHEARVVPIYALLVARRDGKLGPRLRPADAKCGAAASTYFPVVPDPSAPPPCGDFRMGPRRLVGRGMTMARLASLLAPRVGRVVVDATALSDAFDIELDWTPDQLQQTDNPQPNDAPSLFTALQEELGLKLESTRGPVDVLVIDRAERPTED
jgi:hypothetical protein